MQYGICSDGSVLVLFNSPGEVKKGISFLNLVLEKKYKDQKEFLKTAGAIVQKASGDRFIFLFNDTYRNIGIEVLTMFMRKYEIEDNLEQALNTLNFLQSIEPGFKVEPEY